MAAKAPITLAAKDLPPSKERRARRSYGSNRQQILDAALRLFNDQGVGPVSTNHISAEVGISPGNLYYHFRNKEDIVWALLQNLLGELRLHFESASKLDLAELLGWLMGNGVDIMWRYRFVFEDRATVGRLDRRFATVAHVFHREFLAHVEDRISVSVTKGWLVADLGREHIRSIAAITWIIVQGVFDYARNDAATESITKDDVRRAYALMFNLYLPYVATDKSPTALDAIVRRA